MVSRILQADCRVGSSLEAATEILGAPCCSSAEQVMSAARDYQEMMHFFILLGLLLHLPSRPDHEPLRVYLLPFGFRGIRRPVRRISIKAMSGFGPGECMWGRLRGVAAKVPGHPVYRLARRRLQGFFNTLNEVLMQSGGMQVVAPAQRIKGILLVSSAQTPVL